jgi:alkyl sulfatase BDS1-like metallo-beta-lactamase superfamily hydrolase
VRSAVAIALLLLALACGGEEPPAQAIGPQALREHTAEFERRVYTVTDGVHVAVGYALANSILIEGENGAIVVDVLGSVEAARTVRAEFEKITQKPIVALVYTHNHADHVFGGRGFVPEGDVEVFSHATTEYYVDRVVSILRPIIALRSARMFGGHLPQQGPDAFINAGIGPRLEIGHGEGTLSFLRPTRTFQDRYEVTVAGVRMELVHAPGETNDQIFVWLPDKQVLLPGDNVYKAFPNLYTIRGTLYRDVLDWVHSIDTMRALEPEYLVPSHTRPVAGREKIAGILTAYRDAIQYVHDQTVRGMNRGLTPDELVETVELPPHLRRHPYLQEFYGTVEWSVRSIFSGYLGWFDGDAATLSPAGPAERARGYAELAGGPRPLVDAARRALEEERFAWAAELAGHAARSDSVAEEAREIQARALRELGRRSMSPNGRNYYITQAMERDGSLEIPGVQIDESVMGLVRSVPIRNFMAAMPVNLNPERSADADVLVGFRFPDVDRGFALHVRRGVAEFRDSYPEDPDIGVTVDSQVWKEIVLRLRNPALALASDDVQVEGSTLKLIGFLRMFRD